MVSGTQRPTHLRGLTNRLPAAHPDLNDVRETRQHSLQSAGMKPGKTINVTSAANERARTALRALVLVAAFAALLAVAGPAGAAKSCGRAVIDDWYEDGRVDGTYALHCYDDAIENLPRDVRDYSSAKDDIQRALQARMRGDDAPPAQTDPTPGDEGSSGGGTSGGGSGGSGTPGEETPTETTASANGDGEGAGTEAAGPTQTDSASSVPIPLMILAGLALLLIAGGTAGYLIRRYQARRIPPTAA
jgi:cobalamin biosynthesis Mg chelatase CobN